MNLKQFDQLKVGSKISHQGTVQIVSAVEAYPEFKGHGPDGRAVHVRETHSITTESGNRLVRTDAILSQVKVVK
jgi:hypothetical protein